jgi:hypothetical protein
MGDGTTTYSNLGYFIDVDTSVVDWDNTGYATATSKNQGADLYGNLNAIAPTATLKSILGNVKALLYKLSTQVTTLNNESTTSVNGSDLRFSFQYDAATDKLGCLDINGDFYPFDNGGGSSTDDATAYAKNIESGYTAYCRGEKITGTATVTRTIEYYGTATDLSLARYKLAAASNSNYAIFAGGYAYFGNGLFNQADAVDAYNSSLVRTTASNLYRTAQELAATSIGDYAIFGGGYGLPNPSYASLGPIQFANAYNSSLSQNVFYLSAARYLLAATSIGDYALFGGGYGGSYSDPSSYYTNVDAYNESLTRSLPTGLSEGRNALAAASNSNYALFGGGINSDHSSRTTVDAYSASLTRSTPTVLQQYQSYAPASNAGEYIIFGAKTKYVTVYNNSLTRSSRAAYNNDCQYYTADNLGNFALFYGGQYYSSSYIYDGRCRIYDNKLTITDNWNLTGYSNLAATSIGNYSLSGGGYAGANQYDIISRVNVLYMTGYTSGGSEEYIEDLDIDTSDATIHMENVEQGYTAYARSYKITGCAIRDLTIEKYSGAIDNLSEGRLYLAAASNSNYALFGGGTNNTSSTTAGRLNTVDAYNSSLVRSTATGLSAAKFNLAATNIGDYALFGGGYTGDAITNYYNSTVNAYNSSLVRSTATNLSEAKAYLAGSTNISYALFGGGRGGNINVSQYYSSVDAYNSSLTKSSPTSLSVSPFNLAATNIDKYVLFGGGRNSSYATNKVNAYNRSLSRSIPSNLTNYSSGLSATNNTNYAIFAGGYDNVSKNNVLSSVDAYNSSLTKSTPASLSYARQFMSSTTIDDYAIFAGGYGGSTAYDVVEIYDKSLTKMSGSKYLLSVGRYYLAATSIGTYAIFGGGRNSSGISDTLDVYYLS